jgi:hypothetical protein
MEHDYAWHSKPITDADLELALTELDAADRDAQVGAS